MRERNDLKCSGLQTRRGYQQLSPKRARRRINRVRLGSRAVLRTQLWPLQLRVRSTPNSGHHSDGSEHLRFVPTSDVSRRSKLRVQMLNLFDHLVGADDQRRRDASS
jgi:hypothetical protein